MDDATALALNGFQEANLEPDDGFAAVCQVVLNRTARKFQSTGTIHGTIFWPNAFSWTAWQMVGGKYTKIAHTSQEIDARADDLLRRAMMYRDAWARATKIAGEVHAGTYAGADFAKITPDTVLYVNLAISDPVWAIGSKLVCKIGHHSFYRN